MAKTKIDWADRVWNPIVGCEVVSAGCTNCYAMAMAARLERMNPDLAHYRGLTRKFNGNTVWTGRIGIAPDSVLTAPLRRKKPTVWFVNSMGDLFHEAVPFDAIDRVFAVMALCPQHTFVVLTKRPERMREYLTRQAGGGKQDVRNHLAFVVVGQILDLWAPGWQSEGIDGPHRSRGIKAGTMWPLPNVVLGVSVEDQKTADERVPILLDTPAATRIASYEPALGPVDWRALFRHCPTHDFRGGFCIGQCPDSRFLDGIIMGGESGPKARAMHPDWVRQTRDQCAAAGVPFFFKQWGEWAPGECDSGPVPTHTRKSADWWNGCWMYGASTPTDMESMHRDDEPEVWRVGKANARRWLDGREHNDLPWARGD